VQITFSSEKKITMQIVEFRITLPLTLPEYDIAQRFTVSEFSKAETGGGQGVEVHEDKKFSGMLDGHHRNGQYTLKTYFLASKLPAFVASLMNPEYFELKEQCWNVFPHGKCIYTNPKYMKDDFLVTVDSMHIDDDGSTENALNLSPEELELRTIVFIDIAKDEVGSNHFSRYKDDPKKYHSQKSGRGPLTSDWQTSGKYPTMTCYKVVKAYFRWWGLQSIIEYLLIKNIHDVLLVFHQKLFCLMDNWYGLTKEGLEAVEAQTRKELQHMRKFGEMRGIGAGNAFPLVAPEKPKNLKPIEEIAMTQEIITPQSDKILYQDSPSKRSIVNRFMGPSTEEQSFIDPIDGSRQTRMVIKGYHQDIVLTFPDNYKEEGEN
jgi:hypothetical protein